MLKQVQHDKLHCLTTFAEVSAFYKEESGKKRLVIVPQRKEIPKGTLLSILEQAGLTRDDFVRLLHS